MKATMTISKMVLAVFYHSFSTYTNHFRAETKDERVFLLDESLHFRSNFVDGTIVLAWRDLSGDPGDVYKFICDSSTQPGVSHTFELVGI